MRQTILGKTGLQVSVLGFGCMRLPTRNGHVDRDLSTPLLRRAMTLGINLFDTAPGYGPAPGESESALGEALEGHRDQVVISTKNPLRKTTPEAWRAQLELSLTRLRTDHIDLYHLHGINWADYEQHFDPAKGGLVRELHRAKAEGLIRHAAFSFHDAPEALVRLAETGCFENVIVQYNLLDQSNAQAITRAHELGLGVIVMGPVGGGRLGISSERIQEMLGVGSTIEAAFRFVWAHPGVNVALSGMENLAMLEANVALADAAKPFTGEQVAQLNALVRERKERSGLYCSGCRYCIPVCPAGIDIPAIFDHLNQALVFGLDRPERYAGFKGTARECLDCGRCVAACPQQIAIPDRLRDAAERWDGGFGSLAVDVRPESVAADGSYALKLRTLNFSRQSAEVQYTATSEAGTSIAVGASAQAQLKPFARHAFPIQGGSDPNMGLISLRSRLTSAGRKTDHNLDYRYLLLPESVADDWDSGTWHRFQPSAEHFSASKETAPLHACRFRLGRDAEALILHAEVDDDFLYPSIPDRDRGSYSVDQLELFLDGRPLETCRNGIYGPGVWQIFLYPGTPGQHPAFFSSRGDLKLIIRSERSPRGYRIAARLPFASFCTSPLPPKRIGFDLAVNTADVSGRRVGQYHYAGDGDNWRSTAKFRDIWLV